MGVVTLDAPKLGAFPTRSIPRSVLSTVNAGLPVTMYCPVTAGTERDDILLSNLRSVIVLKRVPIGGVMTIEAKFVVAVLQFDVLVFHPKALHFPARLEGTVTLNAVITPTQFDKIESLRLAGGCLVQVRVTRQGAVWGLSRLLLSGRCC